MKKKNFRLFDAVLASVCIILVAEAAAPSAAIGNSQYFWWIFLLAAFFLPYGLVSAELGTAYSDSGGLFDWVKRAYGRSWGSRVAWYYWINFAFWMASLAVLFTGVIDQAFGTELPTVFALIIQLIFIWAVCFLSLFSISENKTLINIGTAFKIIIMVVLGIFGIYYGTTHGFANPVTSVRDLLPGIDGIPFISIILFNFMGFEVVTTFSSEMKNPKKQIPQALLMGGICIAVFYIFAAFGIGVAIPIDELSTSEGLLESFNYFFDNLGIAGNVLLPVVGIVFLYTLVVNLLSWALGVNYVASYAADNNAMPKIFGLKNKNESPLGAAIMNGVVASILVIAAPFIPDQDIFWGFFALQIITLLMSYMLMFPAFKKLRRIDPEAERPFKVPGGPGIINLFTYLPLVLLILAAVFCMIYPNGDGTWTFDKILVFGTIVAIIAGEIITYTTGKKSVNGGGAG
ncbi:MAG: APC family permease [Treponema sp.]|jgi:amino acid transporter|nr:APC family permease [Treponema sp.]